MAHHHVEQSVENVTVTIDDTRYSLFVKKMIGKGGQHMNRTTRLLYTVHTWQNTITASDGLDI